METILNASKVSAEDHSSDGESKQTKKSKLGDMN